MEWRGTVTFHFANLRRRLDVRLLRRKTNKTWAKLFLNCEGRGGLGVDPPTHRPSSPLLLWSPRPRRQRRQKMLLKLNPLVPKARKKMWPQTLERGGGGLEGAGGLLLRLAAALSGRALHASRPRYSGVLTVLWSWFRWQLCGYVVPLLQIERRAARERRGGGGVPPELPGPLHIHTPRQRVRPVTCDGARTNAGNCRGHPTPGPPAICPRVCGTYSAAPGPRSGVGCGLGSWSRHSRSSE